MSVSTPNRKMFDHGDCEITVFGNSVENWKKIEYEQTEETQLNYGRGVNPIGYSRGKIAYSCTWSLGMDEVMEIGRIAGVNGDPTSIKPFPIIISYLNETYGILTDIVTAKFTNVKRNTESGAMDLVTDFTLLVLSIDWDSQNV